MRRKAVERLSSTKKRKKDGVTSEGDNNSDDGVSPIKKKSSQTNLVSIVEASIAMKKMRKRNIGSFATESWS